MRRFCSFWRGCSKIAFKGSWAHARAWQWLIGVPLVTGLLAYVATQLGKTKLSTGHPIVDGVLTAAGALIFTWLAVFFTRLANVPVMLDQQKLDMKDAEHLLGGLFYNGTFMYAGEITLCKQFDGRVEIEQLKNHFANIRIRAPRNSFAKIRIEFFNSWQITNAKHVFYYRDQKNERTLVEDIYQDQGVYLDEDCCFQLMLLCDESYAIEDRATLRITIRSWTK